MKTEEHWQRSTEELETELHEQMAALRSSCAAYNLGSHWEAKRIANAISILVDDRKSSVSVLTMLNWLDGMKLLSSSISDSVNDTAHCSLVDIAISFSNSGAIESYEPRLDEFVDYKLVQATPAGPALAMMLEQIRSAAGF